jgi:hypothetical protein
MSSFLETVGVNLDALIRGSFCRLTASAGKAIVEKGNESRHGKVEVRYRRSEHGKEWSE